MVVSVPNTNKIKPESESDLIMLYKLFASKYKTNPEKQLEHFIKLVGNEHETPRVFTVLINLLGMILDKNIELMGDVINVLVKAIQTKRMNVENCDYILEIMNAKKKSLHGFASANLAMFIKQITAYKNAMQTLEDIIENPMPNNIDGGSKPCANTKYGVVRPQITTLYGVSKPSANTKYGVVNPITPMYGVSASCLKSKKRGGEGL